MLVYVYIYIYTHKYVHIHINTYIYTHKYTYICILFGNSKDLGIAKTIFNKKEGKIGGLTPILQYQAIVINTGSSIRICQFNDIALRVQKCFYMVVWLSIRVPR